MSFKARFSKSDSLKLLLVCIFPVNFWAILVVLRESEIWFTKRDLIYGLGTTGYTLGLALLESLLLFGFIYLLSFLFPKRWTPQTALAVASALALTLAGWAIANNFYFMWKKDPFWPWEWLHLWVYYRHRIAFPLFVSVVTASFAIPLLTIPRFAKVQKATLALIEKTSLLTFIYLFIDLVSITITVIHNII